MSRTGLCVAVLLFGAATGCDSGPHSAAGFRLPSYGDIERGRAEFVALDCHKCHVVSGAELPASGASTTVPVVLGGETAKQMTDGYLTTAIINPSHALGAYPRPAVTSDGRTSRMPEHRAITAQQLTDIVAFLQSRYKLRIAGADRYAASY